MIAGTLIEKLLFRLNNIFGYYIPWSVKQRIASFLYPKGSIMPKILNVDITSSCNLRCPSCPVGNTGIENKSHGIMDQSLFRKIIRKARDEHDIRIIAIYNWSEPFLHPDLPNFIRIIHEEKLCSMISTNLNIARNINEVAQAAPDFIRISLSGFFQKSYGKTHLRGDIEKVKANMLTLSNALKTAKNRKTSVTVLYHKYLHNLEELPLMRSYAKKLGFSWWEYWALYITVEKLLQFMKGTISEKEATFINDEYALPVKEAVNLARLQPSAKQCVFLQNRITLDYQGNINLCCVTYEKANQLGNFLEMSYAEINMAKENHPTCKECNYYGLDRYFTQLDLPDVRYKLDQLAQTHVRLAYPEHEAASLFTHLGEVIHEKN